MEVDHPFVGRRFIAVVSSVEGCDDDDDAMAVSDER